MESFDAFHLPGLALPSDQPFRELTFGEGQWRVVVRAPALSAEQLRDLLRSLDEARRNYLVRLPVFEIADRLGRAINRWLDPYSPYLRDCQRLLPVVTGYSLEAIRKGLPALLGGYRQENLLRLLSDELDDPTMLDGFRPRRAGSGLSRAFGPRLTAHVFAGNIPGLPVQSLACATLAKSASIGKSASEEPIFPALLARSLAEVDPLLGAALAISWWPGGEREVEDALFDRAEAVIAYGSEPAVDAIRAALPPGKRFVSYGHKVSFGLIGREALAGDAVGVTASLAAYDAAKYDQQGCLSPHLFYLERGGETQPSEFATRLARELARLQRLVPRGRIRREEAASIAALRRSHEFRAAIGEQSVLLTPDDNAWTVLLDDDPEFAPSCLNRTVQLRVLDRLDDAPAHLAALGARLQTAGLAVGADRLQPLAEALGEIGIDRVCPLGQMADPAPTWHHDGRPNLLDLLRWTDLEEPSSGGRWEFDHPTLGVFGRLGPVEAPEADQSGSMRGRELIARVGKEE